MRPSDIATIRHATTAVALAAAALLAACSDSPTAPGASSATQPSLGRGNGKAKGFGRAKHAEFGPAGADTVVRDFVIEPSGGTYYVGQHKVVFPAKAVCDPARSSYGPGEWDQPCVVATSGVAVHARAWTGSDGHPRIEFEPAMRFSRDRSVTLYLWDRDAANQLAQLDIYYSFGGMVYDEAADDSSLRTQVQRGNDFAYRRIKHFSGYMVGTRATADESGNSGELEQ